MIKFFFLCAILFVSCSTVRKGDFKEKPPADEKVSATYFNKAISEAERSIEEFARTGDASGAQQSIRRLRSVYKELSRKSDYVTALYYLGALSEIVRENRPAKNFYEAAIGYERHYPSLINLSRLHIREGDFDRAISLLRPLLKKRENDREAEAYGYEINYSLAYAYYGKKHFKSAEKLLSEMMKKGVPGYSIYPLLAHVFERQGKKEMARFVLYCGMERYPERAELYYLMGKFDLAENMDRSLLMFEKALSIDERYVPARIQLIEYYVSRQNCQRAGKYVMDKSETDNADYYLALGRLYTCQGQNDLAMRAYNHVLKLDGDNKFALYNLGYLYFHHFSNPKASLKYFRSYSEKLKKGSNDRGLPARDKVDFYISVIEKDLKIKEKGRNAGKRVEERKKEKEEVKIKK